MNQDTKLSVSETAVKLGVKPRTIHRWIEKGYFPGAYKVGLAPNSPYRIPQSNVDAFLKKRERRVTTVSLEE